MAEIVFKAAFFGIIAILLIAGIVDIKLINSDDQSISEWLIQNPGWYVWGAFVMLQFVILLGLHLYLEATK